jgi:DNA gyrase inhibitor GyrI
VLGEGAKMNLTSEPDTIFWTPTPYIYLEKIGPFQETAMAAWKELTAFIPALEPYNDINKYFSLYKTKPTQVYRAAVGVSDPPLDLPKGLAYGLFGGGNYLRFVLTGSYSQLPQACGRVFEMVAARKIPLRDDYCIEHYVNSPKTTPEDKLITEILLPGEL